MKINETFYLISPSILESLYYRGVCYGQKHAHQTADMETSKFRSACADLQDHLKWLVHNEKIKEFSINLSVDV